MDKRTLYVIDTIPGIKQEIANVLKSMGDMVVLAEDVPIPKPDMTYDKREAFVKRADKRLNHNPEAYLNINRRKNKRRY